MQSSGLFCRSKRWTSHPWLARAARTKGERVRWARMGESGRCTCTRCTGGAVASMHSPRFAPGSCRFHVDRPGIGDRGQDTYNYGGTVLHFTRHTPCDRVTRQTPRYPAPDALCMRFCAGIRPVQGRIQLISGYCCPLRDHRRTCLNFARIL